MTSVTSSPVSVGMPWSAATEPSGTAAINSAAKSSIVAFKRGAAPMSPAEVQAAKQTLEKLLNGSAEPAQARKLLDWVKTPSGQAVFKQVVGAVKLGSLIALPLSLGGSADRNLQQRPYAEEQAGEGNLRTLFDFMIERADPKALLSFSRGDNKQRIALENLRDIVFELLGDGHLAQAHQLLEPLAAQMQSDGLLGQQLTATEWAERMTRRFVPAPVEPAQTPGTSAEAPTRAVPETLAQRSNTVVSQLGAAVRDFNAEPAALQRDALQQRLDAATALYQQSGERWGAQARNGYLAYRDQTERALGRPTAEDRALQSVATLAQSIREYSAEPTAGRRNALNDALAQTASLHRRGAGQWPQAALDNFAALQPQAERALGQPVPSPARPADGGSTPTPPPDDGDEPKPLPKDIAHQGENLLKIDSGNRVERAKRAAHNATTAEELKAALDELAEIAPDLLLEMLDDPDFRDILTGKLDHMLPAERAIAIQAMRTAAAAAQANLRATAETAQAATASVTASANNPEVPVSTRPSPDASASDGEPVVETQLRWTLPQSEPEITVLPQEKPALPEPFSEFDTATTAAKTLFPESGALKLFDRDRVHLNERVSGEVLKRVEGMDFMTDPQQWFEHWSGIAAVMGKSNGKLTLADLAAIGTANTRTDFTIEHLVSGTPVRIDSRSKGAPATLHDFHPVLFGNRGNSRQPNNVGWAENFGNSGEFGAFARLTVNNDGAALHYKKADLLAKLDEWTQPSSVGATWATINEAFWEAKTQTLSGSERSHVEAALLDMDRLGLLTDSRQTETLRPLIKRVLDVSSQKPNSPERRQAASDLISAMRNGPGPEQMQLEGVWADTALSQVLLEYCERLDLTNPDTVFDLRGIYELYLRKKDSGTLITIDEVQDVLDRNDAPYMDARPSRSK